MDEVIYLTQYYKHHFSDFFVMKGLHEGPGWFVYGRNAEKYGVDETGKGRYVTLCARPDVPARRMKNWNGSVRRGWWTKRDAQAVVDAMNAGDLPHAGRPAIARGGAMIALPSRLPLSAVLARASIASMRTGRQVWVCRDEDYSVFLSLYYRRGTVLLARACGDEIITDEGE